VNDAHMPYLVDPGLVPVAAGCPEGLMSINPFRVADAGFIARLRAFDATVFGSRGLVAPAWVFYDCGLVPGAVLGYMVADASTGFNPTSLMIALPTAADGVQLIHTLEVSPDIAAVEADALWMRTWALGLASIGLRGALFTESWHHANMDRIAKLGPARVFSAWTPIHDAPSTATLGVDPACGVVAAAGIPPTVLASTDTDFQAIQARIDEGWSCWYLGRRDGRHAFHLATSPPSALVFHAFAAPVTP
jgi:hypothetical protein